MRILLAEDDFVTRKFMSNFLSKYGECDVTVDGMEAVDAFMMALEEGNPYDLVCLDIMMPVMNGLEATKAIRELPREDAKTIPIIAITANAFNEDVEKSKQAGMNAHLTKPLRANEIIGVVSEYINTK